MNNALDLALPWWNARLLKYNLVLVVAGVLAFALYVLVGFSLLPDEAHFEVTWFMLVVQGGGYLFMMLIANSCYLLGPIMECLIRPRDVDRFRRTCFHLGCWFSFCLPFSIPALLAAQALINPDFWRQPD
jgi:hypothetical protein